MLVSPKWQTMWLESQHCSKSIVNVPLPILQTQKILEDLRTNCCSPHKAVQLEALKCWGIWINNQNLDDWRLNAVCFTAVRPLITKKLQPLHKDVDICKLKLSLMWALLLKVQNIMYLEGPQYILEVFLQSCLTWLTSTSGDGYENEISVLIFQLLLAIFKKDEALNDCDKEMFPQLCTDIFHVKKVFHQFVDKFLNIFIHWRKVQDKNVNLKLWKQFLEQCELSCEQIPIPVWHKIFKLTGQICSERNEPVKERLAFLHSCAITLKSALSSSKFIDFGNLLTTPCEALLKKLVELCTVEFKEFFDSEMFFYSKEICEVLSNRSVAISGFDLCISVLDVLEEFCLRSLFWGVWCGLVYCYKVQLFGIDKNHFTKIEKKFYRKLRGVAINFELDRNTLHKDCIAEVSGLVEKHISVLNISCLCTSLSGSENEKTKVRNFTWVGDKFDDEGKNSSQRQFIPISYSKEIVKMAPTRFCGKFSEVSFYKTPNLIPRKTVSVKVDLIKDILKSIGVNSAPSFSNFLFSFRFITLKTTQRDSLNLLLSSSNLSSNLTFRVMEGPDDKKEKKLLVPCLKAKPPLPVPECSPVKKNTVVISERDQKTEIDEEIISIRKTRSRKRAEEEESQRKKKRKSFEILVQEIVRKNKERKTEKNSKRKKSPVMIKSKRNKKVIKEESGKENKKEIKENKKKPVEISDRKLRNSKKEEPKKQKKEKKLFKADGKLENYFKIITRKSGFEMKKEEKRSQKIKKKVKGKTRANRYCKSEKEGERNCEIGWKQTSLKSIMKSKTEKVKQNLRSRSKSIDVPDEKLKIKRKSRKMTESPLAKLSPFKEVFHDHEYARLEPEKFQSYNKVLLAKRMVKVVTSKNRKRSEVKSPGLEEINSESKVILPQKPEKVKKDKNCKTIVENCAMSESLTCEFIPLEESMYEIESEKLETPDKQNFHRKEVELGNCENEALADICVENLKLEEEVDQPIINNVSLLESSEKPTDLKLTTSRRGRKRIRMLDSLKPSKKMKLEEEDLQEEKLPLEVTEKENLEEKPEFMSPTKKEKTGISIPKNEGSPKAMNGMISSRALRMIALVPESTKGGQMQWESSQRVEILKCKKAPNVDKNSRASKMLALLSENVLELEGVNDVKVEELNSNKVWTTPNMKTPVSSLKSPKSIKKRRSIRFDDAKNETVLYQIDTPPSQILEEKEKCRRIRPTKMILNLP